MYSHSTSSTTHTCNSTGEYFPITTNISCLTPWTVYSVSCKKDTGRCSQVGGPGKGPQYIGCTKRPFKTRFSEHIGTATQPCHAETTKSVGVNFRLQGHSHCDMVALPIEKVRSQCKFVLEAREQYWIDKYDTLKQCSVETVEKGLNIK